MKEIEKKKKLLKENRGDTVLELSFLFSEKLWNLCFMRISMKVNFQI